MIFHSVVLGIVQGLTEFLPVSSSAHLALVEQIFRIQSKLQITVFLHFGSAIAIIVAMRKEIKTIITQLSIGHDKSCPYILLLIIGSIPVGVIGLLFSSKVEMSFENLVFIATCLIITGIILWFTRSVRVGLVCAPNRITYLRAFIIGVAQAVAILPGLSRSGITIATGIYLGIDRSEAAKFSFLLAIISILGANLFEINSAFSTQYLAFSIIGVIFSFLASYFAIKGVLKVVKTKYFALFSLYCWVLGFIVFAIG